MVSFHPHDLDFAFGIGELADRAEKLPMLFLESSKVEVGKNVAEKNQAAKGIVFQHRGRCTGAADLRAEMHVGEDQRVVDRRFHTPFITKRCYKDMKCA